MTDLDPTPRPEAELIVAVFAQAISDLFGTAHSNQGERDNVRREALVFLTEERGGWASRRNKLASLIGIDGDLMRQRVIRVLDGDSLGLPAYVGTSLMSNVEEARKLWREKATCPAPRREPPLKAPAPPNTKPKTAKITKYSDIHRLVYRQLKKRPCQFKDLNIAFDGKVSDSVMRKVLASGIEKGEIVRENASWKYRWVEPESAVAAEAA